MPLVHGADVAVAPFPGPIGRDAIVERPGGVSDTSPIPTDRELTGYEVIDLADNSPKRKPRALRAGRTVHGGRAISDVLSVLDHEAVVLALRRKVRDLLEQILAGTVDAPGLP